MTLAADLALCEPRRNSYEYRCLGSHCFLFALSAALRRCVCGHSRTARGRIVASRGECGMTVGPHSTKLPQSWDTESDQLGVPAQRHVTSCIIFAVSCWDNRCCPLASSSISPLVCILSNLDLTRTAAISASNNQRTLQCADVCPI